MKIPVLFTFVFVVTFSAAVFAQDYNTQNENIFSSLDLELQLSSDPAAKMALTGVFTFPFMQGSNPLTQDNNLSLRLTAEASPVSVNGFAELNLTPAAFFVLSGGGMAGSGWNIPAATGIGLNRPENEADLLPRRAVVDGSAFDGVLWRAWGAGTLQFDLGAVIPGDWNHILFQTRHEFRYSAYSRANAGQSWFFENDRGENQNGWVYHAAYILGYHMPRSPVMDTVFLMAELERLLYNTPGGNFWGQNLGRWTFSTGFNFSITPRLSALFALQMRTYRNHGTGNFHNEGYFYRDFELKSEGGRRHLLFHRAALVINYQLR